MFDDPKRDLKRLEKELLAQEDDNWLDRELAEARRLLDEDRTEADGEEDEQTSNEDAVRNFANGYGAGNTDRVDVDLDSYSDELLEAPPVKREKGVRGLLIVIILELLGIAAIGAYWLIQLL